MLILPKSWEEFKSDPGKFITQKKSKRQPNSQFKYHQYVKSMGKEEALKQLIATNAQNTFLPNPFPYDELLLDLPLVLHYLYWTEHELDNNEIQEVVNTKLGFFDSVGFINPPEFQTVKELRHYHVFVNIGKRATSRNIFFSSGIETTTDMGLTDCQW